MDNSDESEGDPCDSGEDLDIMSSDQRTTTTNNTGAQRPIKTSETTSTTQGSTSVNGGNQNYIMSLDFHEPAIAIGSYCKVEQ
jgi:hypothetical protein